MAEPTAEPTAESTAELRAEPTKRGRGTPASITPHRTKSTQAEKIVSREAMQHQAEREATGFWRGGQMKMKAEFATASGCFALVPGKPELMGTPIRKKEPEE